MRNIKILLEDIIESIEKIENYVAGLSFEQFIAKSIVVDVVVRNL